MWKPAYLVEADKVVVVDFDGCLRQIDSINCPELARGSTEFAGSSRLRGCLRKTARFGKFDVVQGLAFRIGLRGSSRELDLTTCSLRSGATRKPCCRLDSSWPPGEELDPSDGLADLMGWLFLDRFDADFRQSTGVTLQKYNLMTTNDVRENINIAAPPEAKLLEQQLEPQKKTDLEIPRQDAERSNQPMDSTTSQAGNARLPYESGANVIEGSEAVRIPEELKQEPVPDGPREELPFAAADTGVGHATTADPGIFTDTGKTPVQASEPKTSWAGAPKNVVEGVVQPLTTGQFKLDTTSMTIPEQVLKTTNNNNNTKIPLEVYNNNSKSPYYGDAADRAENIAPVAPVVDSSSPDGHGNLPVGVLKPAGSLS